jgi:hypothetical protein
MTPSLRPAVQLRHRKISRCLAEDLVRLKQLAVLPLSAFILSATSVGTPARLPLSTSAFLTHSFSVCAEQPIFAEIDMIACQRELCWPFAIGLEPMAPQWLTCPAPVVLHARGPRESICLLSCSLWLHPTQEVKPPANPVRFRESGYCESFNARFRGKFLNGEIFYSLREAQILIEEWRKHYNTKRPHSALGYHPPAPETIVQMDQRPTMH